jgi:S-adenosylmethionine:tRNA ribosyltransferase-isomerase
MKTSEFDFYVPPELIAHEPAARRDQSRLMVLDRARQTIEHKHFYDIVDYLNPGDLLVLNDTKVIPANLVGRKEGSGAKVEVLLVKRVDVAVTFRSPQNGSLKTAATFDKNAQQVWECLVKPGKRLQVGSRVVFGENEVSGTVLEKTASGEQIIEFTGDLESYMRRHGEMPLPPYIKSQKSKVKSQNDGINSEFNLGERYQTVYADKEGASAAPTAGLHFTPELLQGVRDKGVGVSYVTLHTGLATFKPVYAENVEDHTMYSEHYEVPAETIEAVKKAKRVVAVGTTSVRTLESITSGLTTKTQRHEGDTKLFIYPGYKFKIVNAMVTNFHWPRTSLIMLVSAFAGKDFIMRAYQEAIEQKYRFFSFGDAMLIV